MPSTFDFMGRAITPPEQNYMMQNQYGAPQQYIPPMRMPEPEVVVEPGGINFTTIGEDSNSNKMTVTIDNGPTPDVGLPTKKRGRPKKNEVGTVNGSEIVKAEGTVEDQSTLATYSETAFLIKNTIDQVDMVAAEVKHELDAVRNNRTFKNRYNVMVGLTSNLSDLLNAKISAIKEMNNCITKANDMDYKIRKDRKDAEAGLGDDKLIMDLYQNMVQNPVNFNQVPQQPMGNTGNLGIVRAPEDGVAPGQADQGFLNYMANITPEQNMMLLEHNPDVKQCVVFDASTGNRWFQVMNTKTGQPIPNAPTLDPMFMEDVTLDTKNMIAKNINLGQTYPLVVINDGVAKEY